MSPVRFRGSFAEGMSGALLFLRFGLRRHRDKRIVQRSHSLRPTDIDVLVIRPISIEDNKRPSPQ